MKVFLVFLVWWLHDSMMATNCPDYKWGQNCENRCGLHCKHFCDDETGRCHNCIRGYWGDNCNLICPESCKIYCDYMESNNFLYHTNAEYPPALCGPHCNQHTGTCFACPDDHYWGEYCNISCRTIDKDCDRCQSAGKQCSICNQDVSSSSCSSNCYPNCADCGDNGYCYHCLQGFWGRNCTMMCLENCLFCNKFNGACQRCIDGLWGENCTKLCSFNNCSHCNLRNGMCETCEIGLWGPSCENKCSAGCADTRCEKNTGACEICKHLYWGVSCNLTCTIDNCESIIACSKAIGPSCYKCINGKWGIHCSNDCPENCVNDCETRSGDCQVITVASKLSTTQIPSEANLKLVLGLSIGSALVTSLIVTIALHLFKSLFMSRKSQLNKVNNYAMKSKRISSVFTISGSYNTEVKIADDELSPTTKERKKSHPSEQSINQSKDESVKPLKEKKDKSRQRDGVNYLRKSFYHR